MASVSCKCTHGITEKTMIASNDSNVNEDVEKNGTPVAWYISRLETLDPQQTTHLV